jgi:small subunit ribosomal protein S17
VIDGVVVSDKMDKTVVVRAERVVRDPRYEKYVRRYSRFMAHDEENACGVGDRVRIVEHRPISKRKSSTAPSRSESAGRSRPRS